MQNRGGNVASTLAAQQRQSRGSCEIAVAGEDGNRRFVVNSRSKNIGQESEAN